MGTLGKMSRDGKVGRGRVAERPVKTGMARRSTALANTFHPGSRDELKRHGGNFFLAPYKRHNLLQLSVAIVLK